MCTRAHTQDYRIVSRVARSYDTIRSIAAIAVPDTRTVNVKLTNGPPMQSSFRRVINDIILSRPAGRYICIQICLERPPPGAYSSDRSERERQRESGQRKKGKIATKSSADFSNDAPPRQYPIFAENEEIFPRIHRQSQSRSDYPGKVTQF